MQIAGRDFHPGLSTAERVRSKAALVQDFSEIGGPSGFRAVHRYPESFNLFAFSIGKLCVSPSANRPTRNAPDAPTIGRLAGPRSASLVPPAAQADSMDNASRAARGSMGRCGMTRHYQSLPARDQCRAQGGAR